jgi:hypothetical protein
MENEKRKTRTVSFRVPENIIEDIEKEAKTKLVSTNSLINRILLQYVSWDKYEERIRMYPVPRDSLQHILQHLDEMRRNEAVDIIYNSIRDWTLISKKKFDIHSCLQVLEEYCRMVDVAVEETSSDGKRSYVIRHNLGREVSLLITELVTKIFWDIVKIKVDAEMTNTTVIVKLRSSLD